MSKPLALDVSLEKARALHRVWRALNDGDCPKCHTFHRASEIRVSYPPVMRDVFDGRFVADSISCPTCGFTIQRVEIEEIERMFAPAMNAAVAIFETWRSERQGIELRQCIDCGWRGPVSETVHPDDVPAAALCPRCNEMTCPQKGNADE